MKAESIATGFNFYVSVLKIICEKTHAKLWS